MFSYYLIGHGSTGKSFPSDGVNSDVLFQILILSMYTNAPIVFVLSYLSVGVQISEWMLEKALVKHHLTVYIFLSGISLN